MTKKPSSRGTKEQLIKILLSASGIITILTTVIIIYILLTESIGFFSEVSIIDFFTETHWHPTKANKPQFGIWVLLSGTILTTFIASVVAIPVGVIIAVFLREYATDGLRRTLKPLLELLAAVPTVVYGYFALSVLTPFLRTFFPELPFFNALSAGIVMGIMIIPIVSSLSEDALNAVPKALREASYGLGATRFQTAFKVVVPAASSGILVSIILGIARAIGETMIVVMAAGSLPQLTFNPMDSVMTITTYMAETASGDIVFGSIRYKSIFAAGITLFVFTLILNTISFYIRKKYQEKYD
ncbi:phosphate ABC transporter permease subunit PstC [Cyclobacteriaceae bacterium]|nr:phosphate ABC transporter permease subunit PstC [Cyclobacteriaceae bacterium]